MSNRSPPRIRRRRSSEDLLLVLLVHASVFNLLLFQLCATAVSAQEENAASNNGIISNSVMSRSINVINKSPPDGTIIKQGRTVRLSCRTDKRWFFCVWKSPQGDKQCAIQLNKPRNVCDRDPRILLEAGMNNCDIVLRDVQPEDYGSWMCLVNDPDQFESVKENIALEVGVPAEVGFDPDFGSRGELTMTEGESMSVSEHFSLFSVLFKFANVLVFLLSKTVSILCNFVML